MTEPRKLVDWEGIEADFRCGQLTLRQMAQKHGASKSNIERRAKLGRWTRDMSQQVGQRTKAALLEAAAAEYERIAGQAGTEAGQKHISAVEAAAAVNVQIVEGHRKQISRAKNLALKMMEELEADAESVHVRAVTIQRLTSATDTIVKLERLAYSIGQDDGQPAGGWEGFLKEAAE